MRGTASIAAFFIESCICCAKDSALEWRGYDELDALEKGGASKTGCRSWKSSSVAGFRPFLG